MKKLLLLSVLIVLLSRGETLVGERSAENNDVSSSATSVLQTQSIQELTGERKLGKRSYPLFPLAYDYDLVLPWYRLGRSSSYGSYSYGYPGWPLWYGSGWYKGW